MRGPHTPPCPSFDSWAGQRTDLGGGGGNGEQSSWGHCPASCPQCGASGAGPLSPLLPLCPCLATRPLPAIHLEAARPPVLAGDQLLLPSGWMLCSQPLAQAEGPGVPGSTELSPPILQMRKLRPREGERHVQGHPVNPVFFCSSLPCQERRPQTLALTLQKWKHLDLSDRRLPG